MKIGKYLYLGWFATKKLSEDIFVLPNWWDEDGGED